MEFGGNGAFGKSAEHLDIRGSTALTCWGRNKMSKSNPLKFNWGKSPNRWEKEEAVREAIREEIRATGYSVRTSIMEDIMMEKYGAKLLWGKNQYPHELNGIEFKDPHKASLFWLKVKK